MKIRSLLLGVLWLVAPLCVQAEPSKRQIKLLQANCIQCHARENTGAPLMGKSEDWNERKSKGEEALLRNAIQGIRGMPPFGYCSACNEDDLKVLVRFIAGLEEKK